MFDTVSVRQKKPGLSSRSSVMPKKTVEVTMMFRVAKSFSTCFMGKRREHSRKPDAFYDLVQRVSPGPHIDMFSREERDGFDQWGNETGRYTDVV